MLKNVVIFFLWLGPFFLCAQIPKLNQFKIDSNNWWKLNQFQDSLASTSWNKTVEYLLQKNNLPKKQILIAVLDTDFDINHKMLNQVIWTNEDEIKGNNIDDDDNGYKDDYLGWNFLGIKNKDSALAYVLTEEARILRKLDSISFKSLKKKNKIPYNFKDVRSSYDSTIVSLKAKIKPYKDIEANYTFVMDTLRKLTADKISLKTLSDFVTTNDTIKGYVEFAKYYYNNDFPYDEFIKYLKFKELSLDICMNLDYDNRSLIQDKKDYIKDIYYGNNVFGKNKSILEHGTSVSGVIAHSVLDSTDLKYANPTSKYPVKIMPITFTGIGDFTDKDFYVGFKYAVNNGANIINVSQGKAFSIQPKILKKALSFAEKKNVLVVMSAGNQSINLDKNWRFPQSISKIYNREFSNLIIVGASSKKVDENLVDVDTNYGLHSIDIFAPGVDILTCLPNDKFTQSSGTSYAAPIVANIAALIWSHFPELTARQIKKILLNSGTTYNGLVNVPYNTEEKSKDDSFKAKQPFPSLSKSGKIINAFNALILAEKLNAD